MKIAYLTSQYPAVSHTFILREVRALRSRGMTIQTFSVRPPENQGVLGSEAREEAGATRWLVPPRLSQLILALAWSLATRPVLTVVTLFQAVMKREMTIGQRRKWLFYFIEAVLLAYWLGSESFDHLHCHFGNNGSSTGMLAARLAGIPFSMTCHGSALGEIDKNRLKEKVARAAFVACVSKYGRAQLMFACPPEHWDKLHVVRCGVSQSRNPSPDQRDPSIGILCVGRLSPEKGHLVLLDALARLRKQDVDFRCTLVGDGPMRSRIEARIAELHLTPIMTLTGSLTPDRIAKLYRSADVVVLASFSEGVPVVLMEAMAHGCPVVATRVGGVPELVEDGHSGLLVAPGDAEALAGAIQIILDDPIYAKTLTENAAKHVSEKFDLDASAGQLVNLFTRSRENDAKNVVVTKGQPTACSRPLRIQDC